MAELASASDNAEYIMTILERLGQTSITNIGYTIDATAVEK